MSSVFISHAGPDSAKASAVADLLGKASMQVRFDREELRLGDTFLRFMESALSASDYCLLLWSQNAARTPWVQLEWEAALYRSVQERRSFLLLARLDEAPVPALLGPRLRVELFPDLQPGVAQIIATWRDDRAAESETRRPVASAPVPRLPEQGAATVYVTSELFGITVPLDVDLGAPEGVYLDRLLAAFTLPRTLDYEGRVGVRFVYRLMSGEQPLNRSVSLAGQGVEDKSVLWLESTITPYAHSEAVQGALGRAVFRGPRTREEEDLHARALAFARQEYLTAILRSGLGSL
jgi:hypothetical protein